MIYLIIIKKRMKKIKKILKKVDIFAVPFSFRYKKEEKFSTSLGGLVTLVLIFITGLFGIYYFIPFIKRENFTLYYNTINLPYAESIRFDKSNKNLAIGLECENDRNGEILNNYIDLKSTYYKKIKQNETYSEIIYKNINLEDYTYSQFLEKNEVSNSNYPNKNYKRLKFANLNYTISGRYVDDIFSYYEFSLKTKDNLNNDQLDEIKNILLNKDCKLEFYYSDISMDFNDYSKPLNHFIEETFIQLNYDIYSKMNAFFMNHYFEDDNDLFLTFKKIPISKNLFSRTEQYFISKGNNKNNTNIAKIYIRADSKRIDIKRKYQNLMEFFADTFSFWLDIFFLLNFFFDFYNNFYAYHSFSKKLFYFKGVENKHFNFSNQKKEKQINLTGISKEDSNKKEDLNLIYMNSNDSNIIMKNNLKKRNKYSFNLLEILIIKFLKAFKCNICCKKLKSKSILSKKANDIIFYKLDIIYYIKKMLYLDTYQTLINDDKKGIVKFLSMPIISPNEEKSKKYEEYYSEKDFKKFYDEFSKLDEKSNKSKSDEKIVFLSKQHLKEMI